MIPSPLLCSKGPFKAKKNTSTPLLSGQKKNDSSAWRKPLTEAEGVPMFSAGQTRPNMLIPPASTTLLISSPTYLAVGTVDERSSSQQVSEKGWEVLGQQGDIENLSHPARHIHHRLVREAHVQGSVAAFKPGTKDIKLQVVNM